MNNLSQFYTDDLISDFIVNQISKKPKSVLEIGIGEGSLMKAAISKWSNAAFFGGDIDDENVKYIRKQFPAVKIENIDGLKDDLKKKLNIKFGSIDVALCNPPFQLIGPTCQYNQLFDEVGLSKLKSLTKVSTDIVFLAQNLRFLKPGGVLGIIVPDGLVAGNQFQDFRKALVNRVEIHGVYELPMNAFKKTEARTHILIIKNTLPTNSYDIALHGVDISGAITNSIVLNSNKSIGRMDFSFHFWYANNNCTRQLTSVLSEPILRGNRTRKELLASGLEHFHSSDFKKGRLAKFSDSPQEKGVVVAEKNDFIVARVGSRVIGNFVLVKEGRIPLSDCVFRVRVKGDYVDQVFDAFRNGRGQQYFNILAHGVASKFISKKDLEGFPLF